jgi:hypothetical protein
MNINATIGACALAFAFAASNGAEAATHHHRAGIEMEAHSTAQLHTGAKLNVDVADMATGVITSDDSAPDYLHQQIFRVQR